jgi:O-antigen/teichoic acid export membrane protein
MSNRLKSKTLRALPWSFVESLVNGFVGIAQTFIITWYLAPDEMGRAGIALAVAGTIEIITNLGMAEAVIASPSAHTKVSDTAFTGVVMATALGMLCCWMLAAPIGKLYGEPEVSDLLLLAAMTLPFNNLVVVPTALLTRKMRAAVVTLRITMGRITTLVATGVLAAFGWGAWAVVGGSVTGSIITALALLPAITRLPRLRFDRREFKALLVFGSVMSIERLLWGAMGRLFWLIIGYLHGPAILGYFQFAQRLVDETANLIQTFSIRFGLSFFAALKRAGRDPVEAFLKATRLIGVIAPPVFVGIALVIPDAIGSIFDSRWAPAAIVSQLTALGWILGFPRMLVGPLLRAENHVGTILLYALAATATTLFAGLLTGGGGLFIIGLAWIARHIVGVVWSGFVLKRYMRIGYLQQLSSYWRSLLAAGLMAGVVIAVSHAVADWTHTERLLLQAAVGGITYISLILILDRPSVRLIRDLIRGAKVARS